MSNNSFRLLIGQLYDCNRTVMNVVTSVTSRIQLVEQTHPFRLYRRLSVNLNSEVPVHPHRPAADGDN